MRSREARAGYLTVDALVALTLTVLTVAAATALASNAVSRLAQARDRLTAMRIAEDLYDDLYAGARPDGQQSGETGGRSWSYTSTGAGTDERPSIARRLRIVVDRRFGPDLVVEAVAPPAPPAPATASLN